MCLLAVMDINLTYFTATLSNNRADIGGAIGGAVILILLLVSIGVVIWRKRGMLLNVLQVYMHASILVETMLCYLCLCTVHC